MKIGNTKFLGSLLSTFVLISSVQAIDVSPELIELINASSARVGDVDAPKEEEIVRDMEDAQNEEIKSNFSLREQPVQEQSVIEESEGEEVSNEFSSSIAAYYSTTHRAAYHKPINISSDGFDIEIEDKSIWQVHGWDTYKVKKWNHTHTIVIAPNKNIFTKSTYPFKLINLDTNEVVKAKMKFTPVLNDPNIDIYVHWIEDIDYNKRMLRLEDGSLWSIARGDSDVLQYFDRYNIVIVGTNDGWFRGSNPNILICIRNNQYVRGNVLN